MFPVRARLITERQLAVRAHKLSRDELEAGETEGSSVVVGTHHHSLFSKGNVNDKLRLKHLLLHFT